MALRNLITVPDEILRKKSSKIETVGNNEKKLIDDMFKTMYHHSGIGLAAIQIGIPKQIIVLDVSSKDQKKNPMCFINPVIKKISKETSLYEEGCLSLPKTFIEIERPKKCLVEYINKDGLKSEIECDNLLATCIQHEINHLDGKLIIDFLSKLKRDLIVKKLSKSKQNLDKIIV